MTLNQLASKIARFEGKRHQASIGDIREILKILCGIQASYVVKKWKDSEDVQDISGPIGSIISESNKIEFKLRKRRMKK